MTKADIVKNISDKTGMDKSDVQMIAEKLMDEVKNSLKKNENVYLRGFGSFIIKKRAEKTGRNISKNIAVVIPAHNIPAFKPSKTFDKLIILTTSERLIDLSKHERIIFGQPEGRTSKSSVTT